MAGHHTYLRLKALPGADGERWIEGIATTARQDRVGDIVMPQGARYELPLPLLFAHRHEEPVGTVVEASVSAAGIRVRAKLTKGVARADEVWNLVRDKALSLSIGFQSIRSTPMPGGGLRFDEWSWHELSAVSVPANPDARVAIAKCVAYATASAPARTEAPVVDQAWLKSVEPQRAFESELESHYRRFDAAVTLLPKSIRDQADFRRAETVKGVMTFVDPDGEPLASVSLRTKAVTIGAEPPPAPKAVARAAPAVTHADLDALVTGIGRVIGQHVKALRGRVAKLEAARGMADGDGTLGEVADAAIGHHSRLAAIERRLAEVESFRMVFRGRWDAAHRYRKGDICADGSKVFFAVAGSEPGDAKPGRSPHWSLMFHQSALTPENRNVR